MEVESKSIKPPLPMERRPSRILKDYLRDDLSSCSSSGFRSLPRRSSCYSTTTISSIRCLIQEDLMMVINNNNSSIHHRKQKSPKKSPPPPLLSSSRGRSKAASSSTVNSALQKASEGVMNVLKQGIFARNLSRRLKRSFTSNKCRSSNNRDKCDREIGVKVRDIVRWRSFRDLIEENNDELNEQDHLISKSIASPIRPTITTTTTTITATTTTTTANHSWSDSDFTVSEYMLSSTPSWDYSIESKKEFTEKMIADSSVTSVNREDFISMDKGEFGIEKDQLSPVSVHDFPSDEEDEETPSSTFMSSLHKMERTKHKLMNKIRRFESLSRLEPVDLEKRIALIDDDYSSDGEAGEENIIAEEEKYEDEHVKIEEKAQNILQVLVMQNRSEYGYKASAHEPLLLDFFIESLIELEQAKKASKEGGESDEEKMLRGAKEWMNGEYKTLEFVMEESREVHIMEMEKGLIRWNKFEEEQEEVALEIESEVFSSLMNELVLDLLH